MFNSFLSQGFKILPKKNATFPVANVIPSLSGSPVVECLFNMATHRDEKSLGGFEPDHEVTITVETSYLVTPKTIIGKVLTIDGEEWRCDSVRTGEVFTHLSLIDPDKA